MLNLKISMFILCLTAAAAVGSIGTTIIIKMTSPALNSDVVCQPASLLKNTLKKGAIIKDESWDKGF